MMKWTPAFFRRPDGTYYEYSVFLTGGGWDYASAYVNEDDGRQDRVRSAEPRMQYDPHTRFVRGGELHLVMDSGAERTINVEVPGNSGFFLKTVGYGDWKGHKHGRWMGPLHLDGEHIADCWDEEHLGLLGQFRTRRSVSGRAMRSATESWRASSPATGPNSASPPNRTATSGTCDRPSPVAPEHAPWEARGSHSRELVEHAPQTSCRMCADRHRPRDLRRASQRGADASTRDDRRISVTGGVVVDSGEVVDGRVVSIDGPVTINGTVNDDVFVGDGRLIIRGEVNGDVLVVHGDVLITGRLDGDIVALDGRITTRDGAHVTGNVKSRKAPDVAPGTVSGDVKKLNVKNLFAGFLLVFLIYLWIAVTLSVALLGLPVRAVVPPGGRRHRGAGRRFWPTVGWGALIGIVGPILGVLVLVTIIGIPFGLGMFSALNVSRRSATSRARSSWGGSW